MIRKPSVPRGSTAGPHLEPCGDPRREAILDLARRAALIEHEHDLIATTVEQIAAVLRSERCEVLERLTPESLLLRAGRGWPEELMGHTTAALASDSGLARLLTNNEALVVHRDQADSLLADVPMLLHLANDDVMVSTIPLRLQRYPYGVLIVHRPDHEIWSVEDQRFLEAASCMLAVNLERIRTLHHSRLLREVTQAIGSAPDLETALSEALGKVLELTGWDYAESWVPSSDGTLLNCGPAAPRNGNEAWSTFHSRSQGFSFLKGQDLPGRVWSARRPEWITDVTSESAGCCRRDLARRAGLHTALAIPVIFHGEVLVVLVFYLSARLRRDDHFLQLISDAFISLGALFKQKQLEEQAHETLESRVEERTQELLKANRRLALEITQRQQVEEQSRKHLRELARVTRLSTMGEMASGLAHELNQPLCAIVNYAEACLNLIQSGDTQSQSLADALSQVSLQAQRAGEVVRRLSDFIRRREPQASLADVNVIVGDVLELIRPEVVQYDATLRFEEAPYALPVQADIIQIQQVVLNLIRNGLESMENNEPQDRVMTIACNRADESEVRVLVCDRGRGLSADMERLMFEPFHTSKPNGMGMGLCISRSIVQAHKGRLWATANADRGMTFHLALPLAKRSER
jgi:signal transduction histidine kinase